VTRAAVATTMLVEPLPGLSFGAEVRGVDLRRPLSDADATAIRVAWLEHHLLIFRGQARIFRRNKAYKIARLLVGRALARMFAVQVRVSDRDYQPKR
jgi:alpha-ketoglutarate-dependent taurine dioxygenase